MSKRRRLKEENIKLQFREKMFGEERLLAILFEWLGENSKAMLIAGQEVLGMSTGRRPLIYII